MPRGARIKDEEFALYHVIQRGNERKDIFLQEEDKERFFDTLVRMKAKYKFLLHAYCFMDNHLHLLINTRGSDISQIMKSLNVSYVSYFNRKYDRCGHLFQDRFKSSLVADEAYLLEVSRYIHLNPVRAGIVAEPQDYPWSSYSCYMNQEHPQRNLVDTSQVLAQCSKNPTIAKKEYIAYVNRRDEGVAGNPAPLPALENIDVNSFLTSFAAQHKLKREELLAKRTACQELRNQAIRLLRARSGLGYRAIGEIFGGLSESMVSRIVNSSQEPSPIQGGRHETF